MKTRLVVDIITLEKDVVSLSEELRNSDNVQLLRNRRSHVRNSEGFQEVICLLSYRSNCVFFSCSGVRVCFFSPVDITLCYFPLLPAGGVSLLISISGLGLGLRLGLGIGLASFLVGWRRFLTNVNISISQLNCKRFSNAIAKYMSCLLSEVILSEGRGIRDNETDIQIKKTIFFESFS